MSSLDFLTVNDIASYYRRNIELYGVRAPRTMGYRTGPIDDRLIRHLLPVSVPESYSVLDIGCGLGQLIPILKKHFLHSQLELLVGLDLVQEFIGNCIREYPDYVFETQNFLEWESDLRFDLVLAAGVLVTRIADYESYLARFVGKMFSASKGWIAFNVVSSREKSYTAKHIATISDEALAGVLEKFPSVTWQVTKIDVFAGSQDTFVCGVVLPSSI